MFCMPLDMHLMDSPAVLTVSAPVCESRGVLGLILKCPDFTSSLHTKQMADMGITQCMTLGGCMTGIYHCMRKKPADTAYACCGVFSRLHATLPSASACFFRYAATLTKETI